MDRRKTTQLAAIPVGLLVSGLLVTQASSAAFTAQTSTGASTFATSTVQLTNDHVGAAVFTADDIVPGNTGTQTVAVDYTGTTPVDVRMYAEDGDTSSALAAALELTVTVDGTLVYDGTLAGFSAKTTFADGVGTWAPAATAGEDYVVTWELPDTAADTLQGAGTQLTFVWEARTS
ncbi:hypothetical protein [Cellulomonas sp. Leaf334]|uniref:hypothetical protein n=1 Tax=Cellulomonas sp. Leaf334 TaxID=1736339 RepID=UPI0006F7C99E|nr:hypothetical protein [Cellulomonas sp. Leaf334]KQR16786.1 hypothetical protein ASF78_05400 [Cellulomonas sp. Leaf334]